MTIGNDFRLGKLINHVGAFRTGQRAITYQDQYLNSEGILSR